nr:DNA helicase [Tanacetum cinerariifolium]
MDSTICAALSKTTPSVFLVFCRNERSSDSGVCGSSLPFVSSVSGPCKPLLSGGYRSPKSNCSVGEGYPHCAYEFPNDSPFFRSYIRSGLTVLDFKNCLTRSIGAGNELCRTDAHKSTPSNVRWGQPQAQTDTNVCFSPFLHTSNVNLKFTLLSKLCIDRCGLDVIRNKKQKRTRSSSVGSGHHEAAGGVNHGGVTGSYIDIGDCEWVCEYCRATFWYGERVKRDSNFLRPHYHRGCGGGKVVCDPSQLDLEFVSTLIRLLDEHNELVRLFCTARDRVESGHISEFHIRLFSVVGAREYDLPTSGYVRMILEESICMAFMMPFLGEIVKKRGLPHCHTLVWVDSKDKIQNAFEVDQYISTELPDLAIDPEGKCGKNFPKKFIAHTFFDAEGYVHYRRRETHTCASWCGVDLDNGYIVPYNRQLCLAFHSHINVEYCGWSMLIKYLFKYISKGTDKIAAKIIRQRRNSSLIGHLANVHPTSGELFFLPYESLGLLGDDKEWNTALEEAAFSASSQQLRSLFVQILIFCDVADPMRLWKSFWLRMSDNVPRTVSNLLHIQGLYMNDSELEGSVLYGVEKAIYDMVLRAANENKQEMIFVYGHGGTMKTFLWRTLINIMCSEGKIVPVVASLGITSLLLPAGRTAHSRFKLPLDLTDESLCNIKMNTNAASLLVETNLIIWDESPMNDIMCFEALDRTLRDVLDAPEKLFSGKPIVLGGDFLQTLPVKKGASKPEIVFVSIVASDLWPHLKVCKLTENMRLLQPGLNKYEKTRAANFASWLLELGDSKTVTVKENSDGDSSWITVPGEFCIPDDDNGLKNLIGFIYDKITLQHPTAADLQQKAIVCPKNTTADEINETILEMLHGKSMVYTSLDEAILIGSDRGEVKLLYPPEYLNTLEFSGFPSH